MDIIVRQSCSKKRQTDPILRDCLNLVGISDDAREASDSEEEKNYIAESLEQFISMSLPLHLDSFTSGLWLRMWVVHRVRER